jgi:hypothetical protein
VKIGLVLASAFVLAATNIAGCNQNKPSTTSSSKDGGTAPVTGLLAVAKAHIDAMDLDLARKILDLYPASDVAANVERARLAIYEERCQDALTLLGPEPSEEASETTGPSGNPAKRDDGGVEGGVASLDAAPGNAQQGDGGPDDAGRAGVAQSEGFVEDARFLRYIAAGCTRVTAGTVTKEIPEVGISVRFQDGFDGGLEADLVRVVRVAKAALARDLEIDWPKTVRVTVVRDSFSLSAMTGLPYSSAKTTGTVAVAKWGRVTMISPRAPERGYGWEDTVAHELTHLAIARATADRAPLWLHEGVAKHQETRWRPPKVSDEKPHPDAITRMGFERKLDLPLDRLGPSLAMLPSAEMASVVYAEVTSFVKFLVAEDAKGKVRLTPTAGPSSSSGSAANGKAEPAAKGILGALLRAIRTAKSVDDAMVQVTGKSLRAWDEIWRKQIAALPLDPATLPRPGGLGAAVARAQARKAELYLGQDHVDAAERALAVVPESAWDPRIRGLRARVFLAKGDAKSARQALGSAFLDIPYGPCLSVAMQVNTKEPLLDGRRDFRGDAIAVDPFDPEIACFGDAGDGILDGGAYAVVPKEVERAGVTRDLCEAARLRRVPRLGKE